MRRKSLRERRERIPASLSEGKILSASDPSQGQRQGDPAKWAFAGTLSIGRQDQRIADMKSRVHRSCSQRSGGIALPARDSFRRGGLLESQVRSPRGAKRPSCS